jgi:hypothetical protein
MEAGSNTSTVALRVVESDEKGTQCLGRGDNWGTLFLREIKNGNLALKLGEI